jgi:hypothetical protein
MRKGNKRRAQGSGLRAKNLYGDLRKPAKFTLFVAKPSAGGKWKPKETTHPLSSFRKLRRVIMVKIVPRMTPIRLLMMSLMLKAREGMSFWMNSSATAIRSIKVPAIAMRRQKSEG